MILRPPTGTWSRVAIVVDNPQENPLDDASLTLYVNGEDAGGITFNGVPHVPVLPGLTLDWSAGNPATLFTSPDGTSGETYVSSVQFHATAMTSEMIAGLGNPDSVLMPANDTAASSQTRPVRHQVERPRQPLVDGQHLRAPRNG